MCSCNFVHRGNSVLNFIGTKITSATIQETPQSFNPVPLSVVFVGSIKTDALGSTGLAKLGYEYVNLGKLMNITISGRANSSIHLNPTRYIIISGRANSSFYLKFLIPLFTDPFFHHMTVGMNLIMTRRFLFVTFIFIAIFCTLKTDAGSPHSCSYLVVAAQRKVASVYSCI